MLKINPEEYSKSMQATQKPHSTQSYLFNFMILFTYHLYLSIKSLDRNILSDKNNFLSIMKILVLTKKMISFFEQENPNYINSIITISIHIIYPMPWKIIGNYLYLKKKTKHNTSKMNHITYRHWRNLRVQVNEKREEGN